MKEVEITDHMLQEINDALEMRYKPVEINGTNCFLVDSFVVRIDTFQGCLVVEYADSIEEAKRNMFEDGDLHEVNDNVVEDIISEIEDSRG